MGEIEVSSVPMLSAIVPVIGFALWGIVLVLMIGVWRVTLVLTGQARPSGFPSGVQHGSDMYWRLNRAHMNVAENLPIFAAVTLGGLAMGVGDPMFVQLAFIVLPARMVQSLIHVSSGSALAINFRFAAFAVQIVCWIWMAVIALRHAQTSGLLSAVPLPTI
jgi:hypothetical protein